MTHTLSLLLLVCGAQKKKKHDTSSPTKSKSIAVAVFLNIYTGLCQLDLRFEVRFFADRVVSFPSK